MSGDLLRRAADAERQEWDSAESHRLYPQASAIHLALADVLDVLAYVKDYEGECDYMRTVEPDPSITLAHRILGVVTA